VPFRKRVPERTFHSGTAIAIVSCRVTTTRRSPGDGDHGTLTLAALAARRRAHDGLRSAARAASGPLGIARPFDPYARSWRRERARTNGEHNSHLFI